MFTHDPPAAQTIFAAGDPFGPGTVVGGPEVGKMSGTRVLGGARCCRPRRTRNTITLVVILGRIVHDWDTLAFNALVD